MNRTLKLSIMLALAIGGSQALAQSLGAVQVHSTMDQPLSADIPLTGLSGNPSDVHVKLASDEAFSRAGLSKAGLPVQISLSVGRNAAGQPVIHVSSTAPVRDTYLDFLVEVSAGSTSAIREVTMLLDPPGTPAVPASATTARPSRTSDVPSRIPGRTEGRPSRASATPASAASPSRAAAPASGSIGPVQRGQTLSALARENAGGNDMNRVLVALYKANPDAFYRDNINALKTGAVLRMPSQDDINAQSVAAALAEVRRQNDDWRSGATRTPSSVADGATSTEAPSGKAAGAAGDRLALVPAKEGAEAASTRAGTKGGTGDAQVAGLKQDLATSQEAVASLKQQGAELKSRVSDLEDINTKNQRLLSLKDSEIAELQRKLADAQAAKGKPGAASSAPASAATSAAAPAVSAAQSPAAAASAPAQPASAAAPQAATTAPLAGATAPAGSVATAPAAQPPVRKPAAAPAPTPAPVEETPWFMQPWAWGAGAVVILLLLVAAVARRRKAATVAPVAPSSLADRFGHQEPTIGAMGMDQDQREIIDALAEHPDDIGLHLELVSLYYGRRDVEHFEAAAEAMHAHVADDDQPEWREVVMMGEELAPSHPLFGGKPAPFADDEYDHDTYTPGATQGGHEAAALEEFDLGNYVTSPDEDVRPQPPTPQKHSEYHFNFDLTPVQRSEASHRPHAPDVFDVDAPESPYTEAHAKEETTPLSEFGDILAEEKNTPAPADERPSWSFHEEDEPLRAEEAPRFDEPPRFDDPAYLDESGAPVESETFSDDPVDTKLDLARAYLDMGDAEGARLMLDEVLAEGSQMQQDTARRILDGMA